MRYFKDLDKLKTGKEKNDNMILVCRAIANVRSGRDFEAGAGQDKGAI